MKLNIRNLLLSTAALCATTAFAATQTRVDVPFSFVAGNHVYGAGPYNVSVDAQRSVLTLSSVQETNHSLMSIAVPADGLPARAVSLMFDVKGSDHFLRTIQYGGAITHRLDARPKREVESITTVGE